MRIISRLETTFDVVCFGLLYASLLFVTFPAVKDMYLRLGAQLPQPTEWALHLIYRQYHSPSLYLGGFVVFVVVFGFLEFRYGPANVVLRLVARLAMAGMIAVLWACVWAPF